MINQTMCFTFAYNNDEAETTEYELITEEVEEIFPELVVPDAEGLPLAVQYDVLPVLLLNEMKKQQVTIEALKKDNMHLKITVETMNSTINALQKKIKSFIERTEILEVQVSV